MSDIKKVLVPFENNLRSIAAFEYAAMLASAFGAKIIGLHLADPDDFQNIEDFQQSITELTNEELRPKLKAIHNTYKNIHKIDLQIRGLEKSVHRHIIDFASEQDVDFIVLRSHGQPDEDDWENFFKSTTAYKVVMEAFCPVFTFTKVPENPQVKNILVPLDLSEGSVYKIPLAKKFAKQFGANLHIFCASEHQDDHEELDQLLLEINEDLKNEYHVTTHGVYRSTMPEAIAYCTDNLNIDLVMIMNRPGFRWSDIWISPKAKRILSHSKVPVLSLRSNKPVEI